MLWLYEFSSEAMEDAGKPLKSGNPSRKVVDLAAGEAHNLVLTGEYPNSFFFFVKEN